MKKTKNIIKRVNNNWRSCFLFLFLFFTWRRPGKLLFLTNPSTTRVLGDFQGFLWLHLYRPRQIYRVNAQSLVVTQDKYMTLQGTRNWNIFRIILVFFLNNFYFCSESPVFSPCSQLSKIQQASSIEPFTFWMMK